MTILERHEKMKREILKLIIDFSNDYKKNYTQIIEKREGVIIGNNIVNKSITNLIIEIEINHERLRRNL